MMELIRRITVLKRSGKATEATTVYREPRRRRKGSALISPIEHAARRLVRAQIAWGQEALRRHNRSNRRRRNGWLLDVPVNLAESGRKAFNEARKAVPFRLLPKL
jgi:hypothetical protein